MGGMSALVRLNRPMNRSKSAQCGMICMFGSTHGRRGRHQVYKCTGRTHRTRQSLLARPTCSTIWPSWRLKAWLSEDNGDTEGENARRNRVLLKVSGEALAGSLGFGIDPEVVENVAQEVAAVVHEGIQVAIVVGGGNFFRGESAFQRLRIDRASADYMGMLATVMNALSLQSALECQGIQTRVQSAIEMKEVAEPYIRRRAIRHLERGRVVIFGAGTGNPFFTTDTCAALRAAEVGASCVLKATKVDGVYNEDPTKNPDAKLIPKLSFAQIENENKIAVMDKTAVTLCKENNIPVVVFNIKRKGAMTEVLKGSTEIGTTIS